MGVSKLPLASCTCAVLSVIIALYLASIEPLAPNKDQHNGASEDCTLGDDNQASCNDQHLDRGDENSLIQVLSKIFKLANTSKGPKGSSLAEKEFSQPKPQIVQIPNVSKSSEGSVLVEKQVPELKMNGVRHPMWKPEWHRMLDRGALTAGGCLFIGGIICTAGGIGGGGIYVTVLMFFGELSVYDAIPMSKVVVFAASLPSLILNLSKSIVLEEGSEGPPKSLIDYNVCRVVIPWALIGTLLGVYLNSVLDGQVIVGMLCIILITMTAMISKKGYEQHCDEEELEEKEASVSESPLDSNNSQNPNRQEPTLRNDPNPSLRNAISPSDVKLAISGLLSVIYFSTLRYHAFECQRDSDACKHPIAEVVSFGQFERLKHNFPLVLQMFAQFSVWVPMIFCLAIALMYSHQCVQSEDDWGWGRVASYSTMAVTTGCLAGLVGIGGGLIFAPFYIQMGVDPHVAVATSSTCVIFTSSSTTFQYLFSDRIIVALIFSFGIPHLLAAYTGTKLVHYIQDNYGTKKSYITWIVAFGVAVSTGLAIQKFIAGITAVH